MLIFAMALVATGKAELTPEANGDCWFMITEFAQGHHLNFNFDIITIGL
jgi:hypothetical protein